MSIEEVLARMSVGEKALALDRLVGFLSDNYDTCEHIWSGIEDVIRDDEFDSDEEIEDAIRDDEFDSNDLDFLRVMVHTQPTEVREPPQPIITSPIFPDINKFL